MTRKDLPKRMAEAMQSGMIGYFLPHEIHPACRLWDTKQPLPFAGLASRKGHMPLYLCTLHTDPDLEEWFKAKSAWTGKKQAIGKGCVRFRKPEHFPLNVVGATVGGLPRN